MRRNDLKYFNGDSSKKLDILQLQIIILSLWNGQAYWNGRHIKCVPEQSVKNVDFRNAMCPLVTHILACSEKNVNVFLFVFILIDVFYCTMCIYVLSCIYYFENKHVEISNGFYLFTTVA